LLPFSIEFTPCRGRCLAAHLGGDTARLALSTVGGAAIHAVGTGRTTHGALSTAGGTAVSAFSYGGNRTVCTVTGRDRTIPAVFCLCLGIHGALGIGRSRHQVYDFWWFIGNFLFSTFTHVVTPHLPSLLKIL
jgi:hypothetical protein